ncbi:hypothetical protein X992_5599 [Burkholderia pseudomallei MSHR5492]|nr:hypothetical protein DO64_5999 [Burkholderia pseudomallei]KGS36214.1 hypothetical protein X945_5591 [Burkholderia pseudomallei ABCPW 107]KGS38018.1 hypothetical protein X992_5599 [Burkholderia pseudomallei MSHR5492]KGX68473.1 hypothetical protein Y026_5213 [Burkholderia pseudomallei TSV28]
MPGWRGNSGQKCFKQQNLDQRADMNCKLIEKHLMKMRTILKV